MLRQPITFIVVFWLVALSGYFLSSLWNYPALNYIAGFGFGVLVGVYSKVLINRKEGMGK